MLVRKVGGVARSSLSAARASEGAVDKDVSSSSRRGVVCVGCWNGDDLKSDSGDVDWRRFWELSKVIESGVWSSAFVLSSGVVARDALLSSNNDVRPCTSATANRGVHAGARLDQVHTYRNSCMLEETRFIHPSNALLECALNMRHVSL